jgi:hypothetical protein
MMTSSVHAPTPARGFRRPAPSHGRACLFPGGLTVARPGPRPSGRTNEVKVCCSTTGCSRRDGKCALRRPTRIAVPRLLVAAAMTAYITYCETFVEVLDPPPFAGMDCEQ